MTRILTVGNAVLDDVYVVPVPLRPGEKHRAAATREVIGGPATNAALAIARLGGEAMLVTRIGDDSAGATVRGLLAREGVDLSLSPPCPGCGTSRSAIVVEPNGERTIVNFLDPNLPDEPDWLIRDLPPGTAAVLGDVRWETAALRLFAAARRRGMPAVLDGDRRPADPALIDAATHVAFSAQGLADLAGTRDIAAGLDAARGRVTGWLAVTDGPRGAYVAEGERVLRVPTLAVEVVDTLGAGDAWHGAFALRLAEGAAAIDAVRFANAAAALKCTRFGGRAGLPDRASVEAALAGARLEPEVVR